MPKHNDGLLVDKILIGDQIAGGPRPAAVVPTEVMSNCGC